MTTDEETDILFSMMRWCLAHREEPPTLIRAGAEAFAAAKAHNDYFVRNLPGCAAAKTPDVVWFRSARVEQDDTLGAREFVCR